MSDTKDLQLVRGIPRNLDINSSRNKTYIIDSGAPYGTYYVFPCNAPSNSNLNFTCQVADTKTYVRRQIYLRVQGSTTFTGVSAGAGIPFLQAAGMRSAPGVPVGNAYYFAPRCRPLREITQSIGVTLNNFPFTQNLNLYSRILGNFFETDETAGAEQSLTPTYTDQSQAYGDMDGFPRNPLGGYGNMSTVNSGRGGFSDIIITANTSTGIADTATIQWQFTEPICLSPLSYDLFTQEQLCLIGLNQIQINWQLGGRGAGGGLGPNPGIIGLTQGLWSYSELGVPLATGVTTIQNAQALLQFFTPNPRQFLPDFLTYAYSEPFVYQKQQNVLIPPGSQAIVQLDTVSIPTIPQMGIIWVSQQDQLTNISTTDTFALITGITVQYMNQSGILSTAQPQDLYEIARKNGVNYSYTAWQRYKGSILPLKFGDDIPLQENLAPGVLTKQSFTVQVTFTNISAQAQQFTLNFMTMNEGIVTIQAGGGTISKNIGVLTPEEVMASWDTTPVPMQKSRNVFGNGFSGSGSFWSDVGDFFKRLVRPTISAAQTVLPQLKPLTDIASGVATSYGLGLQGMGRVRGGRLIGQEEMKTL
jgi:hypothetical protein